MSEPYHEVAIEGPRGRAKGFVEGFLAGRGITGRILDAEDEGVAVETLRERVRELLHPAAETVHLLIPGDLVAAVGGAVDQAAASGIPMRVLAVRRIGAARFTFRVATYSRDRGERILARFDRMPEGVRIVPETPLVPRVHPGATASAVYAPAHEYELTGDGLVEGSLEAVLEFRRWCRQDEAIATGRIELIDEG